MSPGVELNPPGARTWWSKGGLTGAPTRKEKEGPICFLIHRTFLRRTEGREGACLHFRFTVFSCPFTLRDLILA